MFTKKLGKSDSGILQQAVECTVFNHGFQFPPAGDMYAVDKELRNEVDGPATAAKHFTGIFTIPEGILFRIPLDRIGGKIKITRPQKFNRLGA